MCEDVTVILDSDKQCTTYTGCGVSPCSHVSGDTLWLTSDRVDTRYHAVKTRQLFQPRGVCVRMDVNSDENTLTLPDEF